MVNVWYKKIIVPRWQCPPLIVSEKQKPWFCLFCCLWVWGSCEIWEKYAMETDKKQTCYIFICCEECLPFLPHWSVRAILHFWSTHEFSLHVELAWMTLRVLCWGSCSSWKCKGGWQNQEKMWSHVWSLIARCKLVGSLSETWQGWPKDRMRTANHNLVALGFFFPAFYLVPDQSVCW